MLVPRRRSPSRAPNRALTTLLGRGRRRGSSGGVKEVMIPPDRVISPPDRGTAPRLVHIRRVLCGRHPNTPDRVTTCCACVKQAGQSPHARRRCGRGSGPHTHTGWTWCGDGVDAPTEACLDGVGWRRSTAPRNRADAAVPYSGMHSAKVRRICTDFAGYDQVFQVEVHPARETHRVLYHMLCPCYSGYDTKRTGSNKQGIEEIYKTSNRLL